MDLLQGARTRCLVVFDEVPPPFDRLWGGGRLVSDTNGPPSDPASLRLKRGREWFQHPRSQRPRRGRLGEVDGIRTRNFQVNSLVLYR